jgi:hypothetical protein
VVGSVEMGEQVAEPARSGIGSLSGEKARATERALTQ